MALSAHISSGAVRRREGEGRGDGRTGKATEKERADTKGNGERERRTNSLKYTFPFVCVRERGAFV